MFFEHARIVIFGGSGSIGTAIAKEILKENPEIVYIVSNDENSIVEARKLFKINQNIECAILDVRDLHALEYFLDNIDAVFNCAAIKHVDLAEEFPLEAVKTNIFGLDNILRACKMQGVTHFIQISTDKVVEPTSVMGATKLIGERLALTYNEEILQTAVVRFGNVG